MTGEYFRNKSTLVSRTLDKIAPLTGEAYLRSPLKQLVDISLATTLAVASHPIQTSLRCINSYLYDGPPYYDHQRVDGLNHKLITVRKIRSMAAEGNTESVTTFGAAIRKHELDELPQLSAASQGKLSLVGIRAISPKDLAELHARRPKTYSRWAEAYAQTSPGLFHLHGVFDSQRKRSVNRRYHWDMFYAKHASLGLDLYILHRGIRRCLKGKSLT